MNIHLKTFTEDQNQKNISDLIINNFVNIIDIPLLQNFLDAIPVPVIILNTQRQHVYSNKALLEMTGEKEMQTFFGKKLGDIFSCVHAFEKPSGCGTTESCTTCGSLKAIVNANGGNTSVEETRILTKDNNAIDLRVYSAPLKIGNEQFTIFSVTDISDEKRRKNLERIFFHDLLNTASSVKALAYNLENANEQESLEFRSHLVNLSDKLVDEICAQRDIYAAENNELSVYLSRCNTFVLINDIYQQFSFSYSNDKKIVIDSDSSVCDFYTDKVLIRRVLSNMVKNALEATLPEGVVTITCLKREEEVEFTVHNNGMIDKEVQLQIFHRSFSTKGFGRGVGTYSMKLLTENYLNGKVGFTSTAENGTVFYCRVPLNMD